MITCYSQDNLREGRYLCPHFTGEKNEDLSELINFISQVMTELKFCAQILCRILRIQQWKSQTRLSAVWNLESSRRTI